MALLFALAFASTSSDLAKLLTTDVVLNGSVEVLLELRLIGCPLLVGFTLTCSDVWAVLVILTGTFWGNAMPFADTENVEVSTVEIARADVMVPMSIRLNFIVFHSCIFPYQNPKGTVTI